MLLLLPVVQYSYHSSLCCYECPVLSVLVSSCGKKHVNSNRLLKAKFGMPTLSYNCYELKPLCNFLSSFIFLMMIKPQHPYTLPAAATVTEITQSREVGVYWDMAQGQDIFGEWLSMFCAAAKWDRSTVWGGTTSPVVVDTKAFYTEWFVTQDYVVLSVDEDICAC